MSDDFKGRGGSPWGAPPGGSGGKPIVEANPEHEISKIYLDFANKIKSTYL